MAARRPYPKGQPIAEAVAVFVQCRRPRAVPATARKAAGRHWRRRSVASGRLAPRQAWRKGRGRSSIDQRTSCYSRQLRAKLVDSAAIMIRLQNLTLQRGPQRLLEDAELTLHAGHKSGLIGANGAGKSSLFARLRADLHPDSGEERKRFVKGKRVSGRG